MAGCVSTASSMSSKRPKTCGRMASRSKAPARMRTAGPLPMATAKWLAQNMASRSPMPMTGSRMVPLKRASTSARKTRCGRGGDGVLLRGARRHGRRRRRRLRAAAGRGLAAALSLLLLQEGVEIDQEVGRLFQFRAGGAEQDAPGHFVLEGAARVPGNRLEAAVTRPETESGKGERRIEFGRICHGVPLREARRSRSPSPADFTGYDPTVPNVPVNGRAREWSGGGESRTPTPHTKALCRSSSRHTSLLYGPPTRMRRNLSCR